MRELPEASVELVVLGAIIRAAEKQCPGFADDVVGMLENEAVRAEVVQLRGVRMEVETRRKFVLASTWANAVRRTTLAVEASRRKVPFWKRPPR